MRLREVGHDGQAQQASEKSLSFPSYEMICHEEENSLQSSVPQKIFVECFQKSMNQVAKIAIFLVSWLSLFAAAAPKPIAPAAGAVTYAPHPHFLWQSDAEAKMEDVHTIQIARDENFASMVCEERIEVVSRFVPLQPLPAAKYWWRVRRSEAEWSQRAALEVRQPQHVFTIRAGSDEKEAARVMAEAQTHFPALVNFEPGEYRWSAADWTGVLRLRGVSDVTLDGCGARLIVRGTFLSVNDSQRVTVRNFHVTGDKPGHTLVRVTAIDAAHAAICVKPEPGYDSDVARFFGGQGFLNRVDPEHRGRHLGGFVSTQSSSAQPADAGHFRIAPVPESALRLQSPGALNVLTLYGDPFVNARHTDALTFRDITLVDMPGAFCGGAENNAKSYLGCRVITRSGNDYQGGHSAVGDGRTGEWIEGCEFQMLADDGPNVRTMRMKIAKAEGDRVVLLEQSWTNTDLRSGDTVAFTHPRTWATATAKVVSASHVHPMRVEVDSALSGMASQIGVSDWSGVYFYRVNPCCEDFVYRRNRHVGGRGHGVKFNGRRGLIADNYFENITGNAIEIGYNWQDAYEGFGASDVLIARNRITRCGWSPISSFSKTPLGGRYIIRDNRIHELRDAAISLRNCSDVTVWGNSFASSSPPQHGAWIIAEDVRQLSTSANRHSDVVPEVKSKQAR
jgi:hypothetical protein